MGILRNVLSSTSDTNIGKVIRGSTRLDTNRSTYFYRTPASAGNRRKWTISLWVKNTNNYEEQVAHTSNYHINAAGTWSPGNQLDAWDISTSEGTHNVKDSLHWSGGVYGVSTAYNYGSFQSCRDISGWYNFVIQVDTENSTAADRCITWTNGYKNELKRSGSYPTIAQDRDTMWNNNSIQYLFAAGGPDGFMDGYVCELYHVDGQVLDASYFGFTDPETGIWRPKKYAGAITTGWFWPLASDIVDEFNSVSFTENGGSTSFTSAGTNSFGLSNCANYAADGKYLSYAVSPASQWTIDFYIKFDDVTSGSNSYVAGWNGTGGSNCCVGITKSGSTWTVWGGTNLTTSTVAAIDTWYHVRLSSSGSSNLKLYVNGTLIGTDSGSDQDPLTPLTFGDMQSGRFDGQIAGVRYVPVDLGAPNSGGEVLSALSDTRPLLDNSDISYGTNGFYLPLDGTGWNAFQDSNNYGQDQSGRGNNWTKSGTMYFTSDSPSGGALSVNNNAGITTTNFPSNYCVWDVNSCANEPMSTVADGATKIAYNSAAWRKIRGSLPMKAGGKYYFEIYTDTTGSIVQGICNSDCDFTASGQHAGQSNYSGYGIYNNGTAGDAEIVNYSASTSSVWAVSDAQWLGVALDLSAGTTTGGKLYFYKNGTMLNSAAAWPGGPGQDIDCTRDWWPAVSVYNTGSGGLWGNFGATPFNYMPPDGFLPVCTNNFQPTFVEPDQHVGVVTYTGSGGTNYLVSAPFQPDLTWIKQRNGANWWVNADSVRGAGKLFSINDDMAQADDGSSLTAMSGFDKNGFRVGSVGGWYTNTLNDPYVSYNWKAGGNKNTFNIDDTGFSTFAATGITAGTITPTGMSVGKDSGFSIVQYTGNDTAGATVPHGLGAKPAFMIIKGINLEDDFVVYHKSEGATKYGHMNGTGAFGTATDRFNDTEPTDNVFSLGTSADVNSSSYNYIAWVWAEKPGLSCFTKYKGNGQVLGPEIPMGFLPALTIVKNSSNGSEWSIIDRVRNAYNLADTWISTSSAAAEASPGYYRDLNSNGMKIRDNGSGVNTDNQDYIVMAWALHPINATHGAQSTGG